ncbi:hypothetical protein ABMA27_016333 [Loxostege sticticalis]|uniref:Smoothelin domain-containing protein n=1 Tax=Loxostege sticticalis TaxID=481309 RepID=A0ABR3I1U3_LOXSC
MSEGDVSLIRDEDVLRRMWQQTEDFSRKKEIRAHMYRLREERLRNLYSPEPPAGDAKDLKELSNAGWNVESENRTTDDGHTHVKTVQANIEGKYDVEGGRGQFAAVDQHKQAVTEYHDDNSSLKRNESSSNTAAHEQVVRKTDDGTQFSSSTTSSSSTSKFQQVSSTKHETVPYVTNDDYDQRQTSYDTNRNESIRRKKVTNDYEQSLRKTDFDSGELVSRKVDYPDDNTKVIVETRCLPDGTRVTSTRREFRAPVVQSSHSEHHSQQTRSENKSYHTTSQQKSDVRDSTSKVTRHNVDSDFVDIVDSQKTSDDYDFKRDQQTRYTTTENNTYDTQKKINKQRYQTDVNETNIRDATMDDIRTIRKQSDMKDNVQTIRQQPDIKEYDQPKNSEERVHHTTRDKVEEVVERKTSTERYQTTYQTDYSQKKISNDWSPSHQAWASTLRGDTPISTRPSTRASSPGGRTFQSSTSSLRSSVSPDKTFRKPPSRGGSPTKVERCSPSRTVSDRYSSNQSTQSVTETRTHRYTSPEARSPHGKSPTRPRYSPDRTPQDGSRPRHSVSPDKRPQDGPYRPSASPDRKSPKSSQTDNYPRTNSPSKHVRPSPERKPASDDNITNSYPRHTSPSRPRDHDGSTPTRASPSPTRKPGDRPTTVEPTNRPRETSPTRRSPGDEPLQSPTKGFSTPTNRHTSPTSNYPRDSSPSKRPSTDNIHGRPSPSPERKPGYTKETTPRQPSASPDRKPSYMRPTGTSKASPTSDAPKGSPLKSPVSPHRKSPVKQTSQTKITKATEDHYTFIDEETKMYTRTDRKDTDVRFMEENRRTTNKPERPHEKSPSPSRKSPSQDTPDYCQPETPRSTLRKTSRSPSPPKGPVTFTQDRIDKVENIQSTEVDVMDVTKHTSHTEDVIKEKLKPKGKDYPSPVKDITSPVKDTPTSNKVTPVREPSPSKYGTYDKKQRRSQEIDEVTKITSDETRYDSLTRREKSSTPRQAPDVPSSPTKKSPRDSVSPTKSVTKDTKFKHTDDFINMERTTEEINKKTVTKERPRQLVTPSTSPTRKPKPVDTAPSTGQSSPTTSVSGFVYFSSPRPQQTIVTDLDDDETYVVTSETDEMTTYQRRPDTLDYKRSPSPSKIPCRSPSPEKRVSPTENLPRKSSLKKPTNYTNQVSPTEKPPSSFRVSPTVETQVHPEHKVVKKDQPDKPTGEPTMKPKPPLERRETYEERCRKILGMMDDEANKTTTKKTLHLKEPLTNIGSPNMSPYLSPSLKDDTPFKYPTKEDTKVTNVTETDFITQEREQILKDSRSDARKPTSRDSSPTKLQDIISQTTCDAKDVTSTTTYTETYDKYHLARQSPEKRTKVEEKPDLKKTVRSSISPEKKTPKEESPSRPSQSPERKTDRYGSPQRPRTVSPTKPLTQSSVSPERKPKSKTADDTKKPDKQPRELSPSKRPKSPEKQPGYMKPTSATLIKQETYDVEENGTFKKTTSDIIDITQQTTISEDVTKLDRGSTSPDRRSPSRDAQSPIKHVPSQKDYSPTHPKSTHLLKQETYDVEESELLKSSKDSKVYPEKAKSPTRKPKEPSGDVVSKSTHLLKQETYDVEDSEVLRNSNISQKHPGKSTLPTRQPKEPSSRVPQSTPGKQLQEPKHSRTPSPTKTSSQITKDTEEFMISEREQEILEKVQKSLRKLSPNRSDKSPTRGKSPPKSTTSLQDIDIVTEESIDNTEVTACYDEVIDEQTTIKIGETHPRKPKDDKPKDQTKMPVKQSSRNPLPVKKTNAVQSPTKVDKSPDSPTKSRSISPKKPVGSVERPQSPQVPKASGIKPREPVYSPGNRKPTIGVTSPTKPDKTFTTTESKKTTGNTTQNTFTKTSTVKTTGKIQSSTSKYSEPEPKRAPTPKNNIVPKKETEIKVTRTASDISLKTKKPSPQRMKSKPEIQVNEAPSTKPSKQSPVSRLQKPSISVPHSKMPNKPKSATALNTPTDDDDVIIDVQQAKSSRENSPDRICPTPINFGEDDVGTPRFPDEVNEPDDDFRQRTHHTIHEAESIVDDIVEICEDDELFVKVTDNRMNDSDECLLSVTDKVSKFTNKIDTVNKTKDVTKHFKDTERKVHSDYIDENLKSDECLLSVSEKVNKFAKGPRDTKDSRSPSRRIVDEYDKNTIYQDDYTKLSVNDKAHLFVETAENVKAPKTKPAQKVERPNLNDVDESLKSDDCLLSVSDKVNKFVKTAEQFLTESHEVEEKEKKIKEQHDLIMRKIVENVDEDIDVSKKVTTEETVVTDESDTVKDTERIKKVRDNRGEKFSSFAKETTSSQSKSKDYSSPNVKPTDKTPTIKITTLRSSEAVKKAKALFENIATTQKTKDTTTLKTTKLTDIGVIKKSPKTDSTIVLHPSIEDGFDATDLDSEVDAGPHTPEVTERPTSKTPTRPQHGRLLDEKPRSSPTRLTTQSPEVPRTRSPMRQSVETTKTVKTDTSRYPTQRAESPSLRPDTEKIPQDKIPGYQRPTKTSQIKEETKIVEETEVSSRRGSGKFGVELRRTSVERSTVSSERRRSVEHHQPCIEDIYDLDLLEQMLEKVVGYEQRRRIRAQIRVARKMAETDQTHNNTNYLRTTKSSTLHVSHSRSPARSPDRQSKSTPQRTTSPERRPKTTPQNTVSPDRQAKTAPPKPERSQPRETPVLLNGHAKEPAKVVSDAPRQRPHSPEKPTPKVATKTRSPVRQASPEKKTRTTSPSKAATPKPKSNRFNEYASAYMKKAGMSESDKLKFAEAKAKKADAIDRRTVNQVDEIKLTETKQVTSSLSKSHTERKSSKDVIEVVHVNGKRSPSPEKKRSPERQAIPNDRLREKSPSPVLKRQRSDTGKETIIKTVLEVDKKVHPKTVQEEKPSWVTNRNLKKITSETRTFSSKKIENEKPKYRAPSPSKVISKPIDVITSSYGPGPLDSDGKPLFGIKALRNGATNFQVKGTVIRQEYHSRNGGEPTGSVSVTAYSNSPEELERLLQVQGERPSRLHGLAAITTTKKFGGDTGTTYKDVHTKEERAALDQFTHSDRRVINTRIEDVSDVISQEDRLDKDRMIEDRQERVTEARQDRVTSDRYATERQDRLTSRHKTEAKQERITTGRQTEGRQERITTDRHAPEGRQERVTEVRQEKESKKEDKPRGQRIEDRRERSERTERREDKKTVRQSSVKSLTEKYIKSASETKTERSTYPKAGLILRTATMKDSVSSDSSAHAGLARTDSDHSLASVEDVVVSSTTDRDGGRVTTTTTTTRRAPGHQVTTTERSFLDSSTKVTGVQDILTRMKNADIVIQEGDTTEDSEARALLNKFLGATVLMSGMQGYVTEGKGGKVSVKQETVRSSSGGKVSSTRSTSSVEHVDLDQCWDERVLRKLLDECTDYEQRRRLRARIRTLMAEQEACASAVTEALAAAGEPTDGTDAGDAREEEEVTTVTSSVRRDSSEKTVSSTTTTKTSKVIESMTRPAPKPVSPFAKFRQLEKQNSTNSPKM